MIVEVEFVKVKIRVFMTELIALMLPGGFPGESVSEARASARATGETAIGINTTVHGQFS